MQDAAERRSYKNIAAGAAAAATVPSIMLANSGGSDSRNTATTLAGAAIADAAIAVTKDQPPNCDDGDEDWVDPAVDPVRT